MLEICLAGGSRGFQGVEAPQGPRESCMGSAEGET